MKSTGRSSPAAAKQKRSRNPNKRQKPTSGPALRREYRQEGRRDEREARHELAEAAHRRERAQHYEQEAAKAQREGYRPEARHDREKAREELAKARKDTARARKHEATARRDEVKARRVGLACAGVRGRGWILGGNDWHEGCAAAALANSLLLATGKRVSDDDVLALHVRAAGHPQARASILGTLEAAARWGLGGNRVSGWSMPKAAQRRTGQGTTHWPCFPAPSDPHTSGLILDLDLTGAQRDQATWDAEPAPPWGPHAALLASDRVVTWGREVPVTAEFLARQTVAAWTVEWGDR